MSQYNTNLRCNMENWTREEVFIYNTIQDVEKLGADPILTDVVIHLNKAKQALATWIVKEKGEDFKPE